VRPACGRGATLRHGRSIRMRRASGDGPHLFLLASLLLVRSASANCVGSTCPQTADATDLIVYTVATGGHDVAAPNYPCAKDWKDKVKFFFFTDELSAPAFAYRHGDGGDGKSPWKLVVVSNASVPEVCRPGNKDPRLLPFYSEAQCLSRDIKIRPHLYLPYFSKPAVSLYMDANSVIACRPLMPFMNLVMEPQKLDMGIFAFGRGLLGEAHYERNWAIDKASYRRQLAALNITMDTHHYSAAIPNRSGFDQRLLAQLTKYQAAEQELEMQRWITLYGKWILRRHNERTKYFNELWWQEFSTGMPRDQLSLQWCAATAARAVGFQWLRLNDSLRQHFSNLGRLKKYGSFYAERELGKIRNRSASARELKIEITL